MHGCSGGACVVARGEGACAVAGWGGMCAWLLQGEHVWLLWGVACVVAPGGVCMVVPGGCAWLLPGGGGMHGCSWGHAWLLREGVHGIRRDTEIRSMSGRYTSYWNAFLFE